MTEAFPIVVFTKQLGNKQRRIMEIAECEILPDAGSSCGSIRNFRTLFNFNITENRLEGERFIISGEHQKISEISGGLRKRFLENGMPHEVLSKTLKGGCDK